MGNTSPRKNIRRNESHTANVWQEEKAKDSGDPLFGGVITFFGERGRKIEEYIGSTLRDVCTWGKKEGRGRALNTASADIHNFLSSLTWLLS